MILKNDWPEPGWFIECDFCSYSDEFERATSWEDTLSQAKREGWKAVNSGGKWSHKCPVCTEKPT